MGKIFHGLNFRGDKFSWVVVAHENLTPTKNYLLVVHETGMAWREEDVEYQNTLCDKTIGLHYRRWGFLYDSEPLGSSRPLSGRSYFRSAIVKVQAHVRTVIPYVANYTLAQFFVGLIFVGNAHPRKLNSHKNFCIYGIMILKWWVHTLYQKRKKIRRRKRG